MDDIDPKIKALVSAIGRTESGESTPDKYNIGLNGNKPGASGEIGRYQFLPETYKNYAQKYLGDANAAPTIENQNKVAYSFVKEKKDAGYNPAQIASMWNAGEGEPDAYKGTFKSGKPSVGRNSLGVPYDVPGYALKVSNYYKQFSNQQGDSNVTDQPDTTQQTPEPSIGRKILNTAGDLTGQRGLGEDIGGSIADIRNKKLYQDALQQHNQVVQSLQDAITAHEQKGEDATRLKNILSQTQADAPKEEDFLSGVQKKTTAQVLADVGQSALGIVGGSILPGGSAVARIGGGAAIGAGMGALGGISSGETDPGKIAEEGAVGGVLGGATGGIIEGVGALSRGVRKLLGGSKTSEEIINMVRNPNTTLEDIGKLSPEDQTAFYKSKQADITERINTQKETDVQNFKQEARDLTEKVAEAGRNTGTVSNVETEALKPQGAKLLTDMSGQYVELTQEAIDDAVKNGFTKDIPVTDIISNIDSKFENNDQGMAESLKKDLGLDNEETTTVSSEKILATAKSYMQQISKSSLSGSRSFNKAEFDLVQKYQALMEVLGDNGVDMTKANTFWKQWATLRKTIVSQIRPFNAVGEAKAPFSNTLRQANSVAKTGAQMDAKIKAQQLIDSLEKAIEKSQKLPEGSLKGTIGKETKAAMEKLTQAQQDKIDAKDVAEQVSKQLKKEKYDLTTNPNKKGSIAYDRHNAKVIAQKRAKIVKIIKNIISIAGVGGPLAEGYMMLNKK